MIIPRSARRMSSAETPHHCASSIADAGAGRTVIAVHRPTAGMSCGAAHEPLLVIECTS
jgi:hypothetical protein